MAKTNLMVLAIFLCGMVSERLAAFVRHDMSWLWPERFGSAQAVFALHPYQRQAVPPRWDLYRHGLLDLRGYGELLLREQGIAYEVEIVAQQRNQQRVDYRYRLQGHDICDLRAAVTRLHDGLIYQRGSYPTAVWHGDMYVWPAQELVAELLHDEFAAQELRIGVASRCLLSTPQGYVPVYDFRVRLGMLPYQVRTDGYEVLAVQRQFYDVQGEFYVYRENKVRNDSKEMFLIDIESGKLVNRYFAAFAITADGKSTVQLHEPSNIFDYADSDSKMAQVSTFAHANLMLQWFEKLGFSWYGNVPVEILVHANFDPTRPDRRNPNNAFYAPPQPLDDGGMSRPRILVGDGDGINLRNLTLDGDVTAHEFGHHVIFQYLKATGGQSGAIHEGLADYFTFARTGNPCLAESSCPPNSGACQLRGQCMRYADHDYSWYNLKGLGVHIEGQIVSAMLWDLRTEFNIAADDVNRIAFNAVQHFTAQSQLRDLIDALLMADRNLFKGKNCVAILNAALSRGLQDFVAPGIDCGNGTTAAELMAEKTSGEVGGNTSNSSGRRNRSSCGTILGSPTSTPYALIIMLLPLLVFFVRQNRVLR